MTLRDYLEELAEKHQFNLETIGNFLVVNPVQMVYGDLVIGIWDHAQRFSIGRMIFTHNGPRAGFTVWLDCDGEPLAAMNDFGSMVKDLALAEDEMCQVIEDRYLDSQKSKQYLYPKSRRGQTRQRLK